MALNYSSLTIEQLINKIEKQRFFQLPYVIAEALKKLNSNSSTGLPYKSLVGQISGSNGEAFSGTEKIRVLENNLPFTITWTKAGTGKYVGTFSSSIDINKLYVNITSVNKQDDLDIVKNNIIFIPSDNKIEIFTINGSEGLQDWFPEATNIGESVIEIRLYN